MSVLAGFSLPTTLIAQSAPRQPNVVIIVADDLGYGDLSCYGAHRIQTPGMDRIANEGIRFTQGYCTAGGYFYPQPVFLAYRIISLDK